MAEQIVHKPLTFGSLFAGIGGFDLGFERAGMVCKFQIEVDDYCQAVLERHWPDIRRHDDVRTELPGPGADWSVDVLVGGFPCQDISNAGNRVGIDGKRSGLWSEFARLIRVLGPRVVVVENVAALLIRGIQRVLGDLAESGFDAEWDCLPTAAFGLPHIRDRLFLVAYTQRERWPRVLQGLQAVIGEEIPKRTGFGRQSDALDSFRGIVHGFERRCGEAAVLGSDDGIPNRVDRLRCVGNSVSPVITEWLGRRLMLAAGTMPATRRQTEAGRMPSLVL